MAVFDIKIYVDKRVNGKVKYFKKMVKVTYK